MARWKIEPHLPFLVIGVEDMQIKLSEPRHRNLTESPNSLPPPTGSTWRFLALRDGSAVGYRETIEGVAADLAPGSEVWIVVYPAQEAAYWPQFCVAVRKGQFKASAQFGRSETKDIGEKFILLIIMASQYASILFHGFRGKGATRGLSTLPPDTQTLARIIVTRR